MTDFYARLRYFVKFEREGRPSRILDYEDEELAMKAIRVSEADGWKCTYLGAREVNDVF